MNTTTRRLLINFLLCTACGAVMYVSIFTFQTHFAELTSPEHALSHVIPFYIIITIIMMGWVIGIIYLYIRDRRADRKSKQLSSEHDELLHSSEVFEKATRSILNTYQQLTYIDLDEDRMEIVYAPFTPQFNDCSYTEVLELYRTHGMIAEKDVEEFANTLSIENIKKVLAKDDYLDIKFYANKPSGATESCIATVAVIDRVDGVPKTVAFSIRSLEDILQEERLQRDLLKATAEQAEAASKAKGEFLSRMSHDMRTPMNAIHGMTSLALMNLDDKERVRDSLTKIDASSRHMLDIINEVLDVSKIESGSMSLNEEPFDLRDLIESVRTLLETQADERGVELRFSCNDVEDYVVIGDAGRLRELLLNIAGNSVKFTDRGGAVALGVQELKRNVLGKRAFVFTIADNGIGMDEAFMKRMFEPFSRDDHARARDAQGTGLGMTIALNIARLMGGDIKVESELGEGTCTKVSLYLGISTETQEGAGADSPAAVSQGASAEEEIADFSEGDFTGKRALVVDDVAINAEVASELLKNIGIQSDIVEDGQKAVDAILNSEPNRYDIVFMDVRMPVMDGYEATRAIRRAASDGRSDLDDLPIVAMTANAFEDDVRDSRVAGMDGHIAKPISLKELKATLTTWLS